MISNALSVQHHEFARSDLIWNGSNGCRSRIEFQQSRAHHRPEVCRCAAATVVSACIVLLIRHVPLALFRLSGMIQSEYALALGLLVY